MINRETSLERPLALVFVIFPPSERKGKTITSWLRPDGGKLILGMFPGVSRLAKRGEAVDDGQYFWVFPFVTIGFWIMEILSQRSDGQVLMSKNQL